MNRPSSRVLGSLFFIVVAGCDSGGTVLQPVAPVRSPSPKATPSAAPSATPAPTASPTSTPSPVTTVSPTAAATTLGRVYVANSSGTGGNDGSITVYQPAASGAQNLAPVATIVGSATELEVPVGVTLDAAGDVYAINQYGATVGSITVYPPNPAGTLNEAPSATISGNLTGLSYPSAIAVDASGYIYVTNGSNRSVTIYPPNPSGTLNEAPYETISGSATGLAAPKGIAVDAAGFIYVVNDNNTSQTGSPMGSVTVYQARTPGTQNIAPLATIVGSATGINYPSGIALDASDRIYVTSDYTTIFGFASNPAGDENEAPFATIAGANTSLEANALTLDAAGRIYTTNPGGTGDPDTITVYAANPSGSLNETPVVTIAGNQTNLDRPTGIAVR